MDTLMWLDYLIISVVGLIVLSVLYFSFRKSRKYKSKGCSGNCAFCLLSSRNRNIKNTASIISPDKNTRKGK